MKGKLLMYALVFAFLLIVFQYVNSKNIFETYQLKMTKHIEKEQVLKVYIFHSESFLNRLLFQTFIQPASKFIKVFRSNAMSGRELIIGIFNG